MVQNFYKADSDSDIKETLANILSKEKYFPLTTGQISTNLSKIINTKKNSQILTALTELQERKAIIEMDSLSGKRYFSTHNLNLLSERILHTLMLYHKKHPEKAGLSVSEIRKHLANDNQKKKQKVICSDLLNFLISELSQNKEIKVQQNIVSLTSFQPATRHINEKIDQFIHRFQQEFNFKKITEEELAEIAKMPLSNFKTILNEMKNRRLFIKIADNIFIDHLSLRKFKEKVKEIIKNKGQVHLKEFTAEFKVSRQNIYPFLDYLDSIGFTRRVDDKRVLAESKNIFVLEAGKQTAETRSEIDCRNSLTNQKPEMAKKECV
ncbi:MAG: SelB C-terminal domain-containing protein [Candidatus Cloacimonetes bacterium]|nr:SelB C-terminal domain-containing protein [Candidatus Cloacimonadota bacterium]